MFSRTLFTAMALLFVLALLVAHHAHAAVLPVAEVLASGNDGNVPANTLDGDLGTRWSARGDGQFIQYQLEACETVSQVQIAFYQGNARVASFAISTSENGMTWTPAFEGDSSGTTLDLEPFDFEDRHACYVRFTGFGNTVNDWNALTEVQIESPDTDELPPMPPGSIPVLDVIASSDDGNVPGNVTDGDLITRWAAKGNGQWIQFDLGETMPRFGEVMMAWYKGHERTATFDIEVSNDETEWTLVYSGYSSRMTTDLEPYRFVPVSARYVRVVNHGNSTNAWISLTEVEFLPAP